MGVSATVAATQNKNGMIAWGQVAANSENGPQAKERQRTVNVAVRTGHAGTVRPSSLWLLPRAELAPPACPALLTSQKHTAPRRPGSPHPVTSLLTLCSCLPACPLGGSLTWPPPLRVSSSTRAWAAAQAPSSPSRDQSPSPTPSRPQEACAVPELLSQSVTRGGQMSSYTSSGPGAGDRRMAAVARCVPPPGV